MSDVWLNEEKKTEIWPVVCQSFSQAIYFDRNYSTQRTVCQHS